MKSSEAMNSKERVFAAIASEEIDRYPVICPTSVANIECMGKSASFFPSAHFDAVKMANLASMAHDELGFDSVMPYFSIHLESSALGCEVDWGGVERIPFVKKRLLTHPETWKRTSDFLEQKEIQALLKAISLLKGKYGETVPIIGKVVGPWTLAYNLYGAENLTLDTVIEPERTKAFISELYNISLKFALAQFEAGADILTWADHVTSDLISPQIYEEFVLSHQQKASVELKKYGPVILHICGDVMDRLADIKSSGFPLFHIDSRNNIQKATDFFGSQVKLCGALNNPVTLLTGSEKDIRKEVKRNIAQGISLIAPECAIPSNVDNKSLLTISETVKSLAVE